LQVFVSSHAITISQSASCKAWAMGHTAKLYIFGKRRMWFIEISMSSLSSVITFMR
jgi:hypothetical protein